MAGRTPPRGGTFGPRPGATVRAGGVTLGGDGRAPFTPGTPPGGAPGRLRPLGGRNVVEAPAAAALAGGPGLAGPGACGRLARGVAAGLSGAPGRGRGGLEAPERADGAPGTTEGSTRTRGGLAAAREPLGAVARGGGAFAVLGPMNELGMSPGSGTRKPA